VENRPVGLKNMNIVEDLLESLLTSTQYVIHIRPYVHQDTSQTSPVAGEAPDGPPEDKKMKACPLAIVHVKNEAEENGPQDMDTFETIPVAGEAPDGPEEEKNDAEENSIVGDAPDGPVDIGEEVLDDRESETSSAHAHAHVPTNTISNNVEATATGPPADNVAERDRRTPGVQEILSTSLTSPGQTPKMIPNHPPILKGQG
jgi:hypothetical protein